MSLLLALEGAITQTLSQSLGNSFGTGAAITQGLHGGYSYSDNFNRADSTSIGTDWTEAEGDFAISGGQLHLVTDGTLGQGVVYLNGAANIFEGPYVEITLRAVNGNIDHVGPMACYDPVTGYYIGANVNGSTAIVFAGSVESGSTSGFVVRNTSFADGDRLGISVSNGAGPKTVYAYKNGVLADTIILENYAFGGYVGIIYRSGPRGDADNFYALGGTFNGTSFTDNFNRANGSLGADWTTSNNGWAVSSNQVVVPGLSIDTYAINTSTTDYLEGYAEIRLPYTAAGSCDDTGPVVHYDASTGENYRAYLLGTDAFSGTTVVVEHVHTDPSIVDTLVSFFTVLPYAPGPGISFTLGLAIGGSGANRYGVVFIENTSVTSFTDNTTFIGKAGMYSFNGGIQSIDDFISDGKTSGATSTIVSGNATSTGAATAGFVGDAVWQVTAASAGAASAGFVGDALWQVTMSSTGAATAAFTGDAFWVFTISSAGAASADASGDAIWQTTISASGAATAADTGDAIWVFTLSSAGSATADFAGSDASAPTSANASASGTSTADFASQAIIAATMSAAGTSTADFAGEATSNVIELAQEFSTSVARAHAQRVHQDDEEVLVIINAFLAMKRAA